MRLGGVGSVDVAEGLSTQPSAPPPLGAGGFARWCWRQLTSMRVALILLVILAIVSIPGSLLPQAGVDPVRVGDWIENNPTWGPILERLGFFDVYASPWFAAVYLLLFISLIGCIVPRSLTYARALRMPPPPAPRNLTRLPAHASGVTTEAAGEILDRAERHLRAARWRVRRGMGAGDEWVAAEKGYWREAGNLAFHISLVVLLVGIAVGGVFGWRGNVIVVEGNGFSNTLTQYDAWGGGRFVDSTSIPPFSFTLSDFEVDFERGEAQRGAPRLFEATLTVRPEPGAPEVTELVRVNEPLVVDGAKVFLVGHGYAPILRVRDASGALVFDDTVPFLPQDGAFTSTGVIKVPDATPQLGFQGLFLPTAAVDEIRGPHSVFPAPDLPRLFLSAWVGDLGLDSGAPQSVYTLKTDLMSQVGLEALAPGETWDLPENLGSIEFVGFSRWASFQVAHDPGKEIALVATIVAIAGLMLSLFVRRRRIWLRVAEGTGSRTVVVGALARGEETRDTDTRLGDEVDALLAASGVRGQTMDREAATDGSQVEEQSRPHEGQTGKGGM